MSDNRLEIVLGWIDAANGSDPNVEILQGVGQPRALLYGKRMSAWLERVYPESSEPLKIAARGQHIRRWEVPRQSYPATRAGYLKWRTYLYGFHADCVAALMQEAGYDSSAIDRVKSLLQKRGIKTDPEAQSLEDVICLVFLENYFAEFAATQNGEKLLNIVRKTWGKMSEKGHGLALELPFTQPVQELLAQALAE
jgi:hypothetical protein